MLTPATQPLNWLWPGRWASGKLTLIDGDPGVGKSLASLDLAARLTSCADMPDGYRPPSAVPIVLISAEDNLCDTILPRLVAAGADLNLVTTWHANEPLLLPKDCSTLQQVIEQTHAKLVILDPFSAFLASLNDVTIHQALDPLAELADTTGAAILLIRHLSKTTAGKQAIYRGLGSIAILGAVRTAFLIAPDLNAAMTSSTKPARELASVRDTPCVLACTKNNLAPLCPSLGYRIITAANGQPQVRWTGIVNRTADDLTVSAHTRRQTLPAAIALLQDQLANGSRERDHLVNLARTEGISLRTLERAKAQLGIVSDQRRRHGCNVWYWSLPVHR